MAEGTRRGLEGRREAPIRVYIERNIWTRIEAQGGQLAMVGWDLLTLERRAAAEPNALVPRAALLE